MRLFSFQTLMWMALLIPVQLNARTGDPEPSATIWKYGVQASAGYFNFRDSLYVDIEPDPSGDLSEDWFEYAIKPWVSFEYETGTGTRCANSVFALRAYAGSVLP